MFSIREQGSKTKTGTRIKIENRSLRIEYSEWFSDGSTNAKRVESH
jgi:hypothetical protein